MNPSIRFNVFAILFTCILSSCASVGVTKIKDHSARSTNCSLEIFSGEADIKRPFEVLCMIDSKTGTSIYENVSGAGAVEIAKPKACECGADGILIVSLGRADSGAGTAVIKAIRFTDK